MTFLLAFLFSFNWPLYFHFQPQNFLFFILQYLFIIFYHFQSWFSVFWVSLRNFWDFYHLDIHHLAFHCCYIHFWWSYQLNYFETLHFKSWFNFHINSYSPYYHIRINFQNCLPSNLVSYFTCILIFTFLDFNWKCFNHNFKWNFAHSMMIKIVYGDENSFLKLKNL